MTKRTLCLAILMLGASSPLPGDSPRSFEFDSYKEVMELFEQLDYTEATWNQGAREVPRAYLQNMPSRWRGTHSKEVEVKMKKEVFLRVLAPLILRSNELISQERERLSQPETDPAWQLNLCIQYRVCDSEAAAVSPAELAQLKERVDIVPNSLALAQTIEESGWGTSRFADQGNAMFGQWAWGENAIKPEQQRSGKGDYGIAAFDNPLESVQGYMRNINTHRAYQALRDERTRVREDEGRPPTGADLAPTLVNYSERGEHYVKSLQSIMSYNKLYESDEARLVGEVIILQPVGEGAD